MKNDLKKAYTDFYRENDPAFTFPPEWVVRTFLGNYPKLDMDKSNYSNCSILDVGFGDGRCFQLLNNLGFDLHGVEITKEIVDLCQARLGQSGIEAALKVGSNTELPYPSESFDYILASSSCYYVDRDKTFEATLQEYNRVLKPGGKLVAAMPNGNSFVFHGAEHQGDGVYLIKNDPYEVRNGYTLRRFDSHEEIQEAFSPYFSSFSFGLIQDDYYGCNVQLFLVVCQKDEQGAD